MIYAIELLGPQLIRTSMLVLVNGMVAAMLLRLL